MLNKNKSIIYYIISFLIIISIFNSSNALDFKNNKMGNPNRILYNLNNFNTTVDNSRFNILHPCSTSPALVERDSNFTISFFADNFEDITVIISTAYEPIVDTFILNNIDYWKENSNWKIKVNIPLSIPEELYNITLLFEIDNEYYKCSKPRSLSIYNEFTDNFSFIHIADIHYGDPRGFVESIQETIGFKSIKRCIKEINLLHPDFVLISGDIVFGQLYPFEYRIEYQNFYDLLQTFDVPTFLVPGNHDGYNRILEDGFDYWKEYFGPLFYSFDYGDYHFTGINSYDMSKIMRLTFLFIPLNWGGSISGEQFDWIKNDLESSDSIKKFIFLHHNPLWETTSDSLIGVGYENRENLLSLIFENGVDMVLAGHNHLDTVNIENDVIFITTTTPESEIRFDDGYWGYRLIKIIDGEIYSYNYKEPKYSIPSYHIDYNIYTYPDFADAYVNNSLELDIEVYIKFLMPNGTYRVENGIIFMQRDDDERSEIYVKSNIQSLINEKISIFKI